MISRRVKPVTCNVCEALKKASSCHIWHDHQRRSKAWSKGEPGEAVVPARPGPAVVRLHTVSRKFARAPRT